MNVSVILARKGSDVATTSPDVTLEAAARLLADKRIGAVVVVDSAGAVAGILSERDIVRAVAQGGGAALADPVSQHMTAEVVTCGRNDLISDLMERMTKGRFRHVPVVEKGRLIGIVSIGDVVKHRIEEAVAESQSLKDYIQMAS